MPFNNEIRAGASGAQSTDFYNGVVNQSLRFNDGDSANLSRTFASSSNRRTWTWSAWIKRSGFDVDDMPLFNAYASSSNYAYIDFRYSSTPGYETLEYFDSNSKYVTTTQVFRDAAAWYHLVVAFDTTQSTEADRIKFYVNGTQITSFSRTAYPSQNDEGPLNQDIEHFLGKWSIGPKYFDGYMADVYFIDGQALDPTSFTETKNGVSIPKEYSGSHGTNGFHLPFSQTKDAGFSALFDTRDTSKIVYSDSSSFDIGGSDDFTIEFFFNTPDVDSNYGNFMGEYATSGPHHLISYDFRNSSTRIIYWYTGNGAAFQWNVSPTTAIAAGKWHHLAFQRDGTILRAYLDGTRLDTVVDAASNTGYSLSDGKSTNFNKSYNLSQITIGDPHGRGFTGYISNVRYVIGNTIYADDDNDITVPTATLTAVTGTKLLTCINATVGDDISSENNDGTVTSTTASTVNPFGTFNFFQDVSGNANHFDPTNINDIDVMPDCPENNFATLNPLFPGNSAVIKDGGLEVEPGGFSSSLYGTVSTFAIPKDKKIYIEVECTDTTGDLWTAGFATNTSLINGPGSTLIGSSGSIMSYNRSVLINGTENDYGSSSGIGGLGVAKFAAGDILGCAIDGASGKVWFSRNGVYYGKPIGHQSGHGDTGNPSAGTNEIGTLTGGTTDEVFFVVSGNASADDVFVNFGQDSQNVATANADANSIGTFEYAPPTDYVALCSSNLTTPDIGPTKSQQADDNFNTILYTGNASSRSLTGVGFQPDWVWIKPRTDADNHVIHDSVRGVQKRLYANDASVEADRSSAGGGSDDGLSSFDSDGFSIGDWNNINQSTINYVAWNWKAGGTASTNSDGSVDAEVSVNTDAGFSIATFTGIATGGDRSFGHGLDKTPTAVIVRRRDPGDFWWVWHHKLAHATDRYLKLNEDSAQISASGTWGGGITSSVVGLRGSSFSSGTSDTFVAYSFTDVEGYAKHGSYKGNNNANGPHVNTGFRPAWLMLKRIDSAASWLIYDNKRDTFNQMQFPLFPNVNNVEYTSNLLHVDFLSNGFKIRNATYGETNAAGDYIYLCFADQPFKFSNAR